MLDYLQGTQDDVASLSADNTQTIKWYINFSFAMHKETRSHTGAVMTLGHRALILKSTKQKVNTRSSTESKMVAVDDTIAKLLWTKKFMEAQGHKVKAYIIYQNNTSAMKLELHGKASSGKRTCHFDIKFFYVTDLIKRGKMQVKYCPTNEMVADYQVH
jgi:hypothetical protein